MKLLVRRVGVAAAIVMVAALLAPSAQDGSGHGFNLPLQSAAQADPDPEGDLTGAASDASDTLACVANTACDDGGNANPVQALRDVACSLAQGVCTSGGDLDLGPIVCKAGFVARLVTSDCDRDSAVSEVQESLDAASETADQLATTLEGEAARLEEEAEGAAHAAVRTDCSDLPDGLQEDCQRDPVQSAGKEVCSAANPRTAGQGVNDLTGAAGQDVTGAVGAVGEYVEELVDWGKTTACILEDGDEPTLPPMPPLEDILSNADPDVGGILSNANTVL